MERKVKYDYAFKEECVKLVSEKHHSYGFVSKLKGAEKSNIRKWVGFYKQYGENGWWIQKFIFIYITISKKAPPIKKE